MRNTVFPLAPTAMARLNAIESFLTEADAAFAFDVSVAYTLIAQRVRPMQTAWTRREQRCGW